MLVKTTFDEILVFDGVAERTGMQFERAVVRRSPGCCGSLTELIRKARDAGDGSFYLPVGVWPPNTERVQLQKTWVVISTSSH